MAALNILLNHFKPGKVKEQLMPEMKSSQTSRGLVAPNMAFSVDGSGGMMAVPGASQPDV